RAGACCAVETAVPTGAGKLARWSVLLAQVTQRQKLVSRVAACQFRRKVARCPLPCLSGRGTSAQGKHPPTKRRGRKQGHSSRRKWKTSPSRSRVSVSSSRPTATR